MEGDYLILIIYICLDNTSHFLRFKLKILSHLLAYLLCNHFEFSNQFTLTPSMHHVELLIAIHCLSKIGASYMTFKFSTITFSLDDLAKFIIKTSVLILNSQSVINPTHCYCLLVIVLYLGRRRIIRV